jgi:hypothetical protein
MPDTMTNMDNRTLLRRTLVTMGAMVGACLAFVGTLTLVAVLMAGKAVAPPNAEADKSGDGKTVPATAVHGTPPAMPKAAPLRTPNKP